LQDFPGIQKEKFEMKRGGAGAGRGQEWHVQGQQGQYGFGRGQGQWQGSSRMGEEQRKSGNGQRSFTSGIPSKKSKPSYEKNRSGGSGGQGGGGGVGQVKALKCLYSHQKLKKKKTWLDGEIKLFLGQRKCVLYKIDEASSTSKEVLDSKYCPDLEMDRIMNGIADSIEFEKYLVEVDHTSSIHCQQEGVPIQNSSSQVPPLNKVQQLTSQLKKVPFKVPQTVAPPPPTPAADPFPMSHGSGSANLNSRKRGFYSIDPDELDDIWDSTHQTSPSSSSPQQSVPSLGKSASSSLAQLDFNFSSSVPLHPTVHSFHTSLSDETELDPVQRQVGEESEGEDEDEYIDLRKIHSTHPGVEYVGNQSLDREESNPWPRYGEDPEEEDGEEEERGEGGEESWPQARGEDINERYDRYTSSPLPSHTPLPCPVPVDIDAPPQAAEKNSTENNIWSRMFDSSQCQIGFIDESSNEIS
jgi:hypothetical protein